MFPKQYSEKFFETHRTDHEIIVKLARGTRSFAFKRNASNHWTIYLPGGGTMVDPLRGTFTGLSEAAKTLYQYCCLNDSAEAAHAKIRAAAKQEKQEKANGNSL